MQRLDVLYRSQNSKTKSPTQVMTTSVSQAMITDCHTV